MVEIQLLARGGGSSQCGQGVNAAVVIDRSKYLDRVLAVDAHGLTFAPDPDTHSRCTLSGMVGNNSCGPRSVMAGFSDRPTLHLAELLVRAL